MLHDASAWHFLVSNGAVHAIVYVTVSVLVGAAVRAVLRELRRIADYLNTHTEGGLRDVLEAIEKHGAPGRRDARKRAGGAHE